MISILKRNVEIIKGIIKNLRSNESRRRLKTLYFLEILVKNCDISFHNNLFTKEFCKILMKILSKVF